MERFIAYLQRQRVCRDVEDTLLWSVTKNDKFIVKLFYNVLELDIGGPFPMSSI